MRADATSRRAVVSLFAALTAAAFGLPATAQDGDTVEGAMWRMQMSSRAKKGEKRLAVFRVADHVLYQKEKKGPDSEEHVIGKDQARPSGPKGSVTVLEFEKLRVIAPGGRGGPGEIVSGKARVECDEFGKWHGRMVDGEGRHWDVNLTRFKE